MENEIKPPVDIGGKVQGKVNIMKRRHELTKEAKCPPKALAYNFQYL